MANVPLQSLLEQANRALETGDADQAIGIAQHILHYVPELIEGHRLLGEAYLNANQPQPALGAFEQVLRADPENIAAYYGLGLGQQSLEQRVEAIRSFERALEIQPNLAELRTQLTRLYAETPGSPGQFRLSRAGLGRLYARGEMYTQAIDEFRAVLDAEPDRNDVRVALAEVLWREGQENEAADWCREALDHQPQLHKPTLILGYLQLAGGQPEGDKLWRRAARQDPHLALARTLFNVLPPVRIDEPQLPAFDLLAWNKEKERPSRAAKPAPVAVNAATDQFDDSWVSGASIEAEQAAQTPPKTPASSVPSVGDDDLLASLLAIDDPPTPSGNSNGNEVHAQAPRIYDTASNQPDTKDEFADVQPFSFDDWNFEDVPAATTPSLSNARSTADPFVDPFVIDTAVGGDVQPFNLDDPGGVQPFSLDDFNFDEAPPSESHTPQRMTDGAQEHNPAAFDDTAPVSFSWQEPSRRTQQSPASGTPSQVNSTFDKLLKRSKPAEPAARPSAEQEDAAEEEFFSLDDADRREPVLAPAAPTPATPASHPAQVQPPAPSAPATNDADAPEPIPFSLADLGLTEDEIAEFEKPQEQGKVAPVPSVLSDEPELTPFSLADLDLTEDEISEFGQTTAHAEPTEAEPHVPAVHDAPVEPRGEPAITPFSLAELGLTEDEISEFDLGESPLPSAKQIAHVEIPEPQGEHQPAPPPPAVPARPVAQSVGAGNLQSYQAQLAADPNNDSLRLAIARMSEQTGNVEQALDYYKQLLRRNVLVDPVAEDLQELITGCDDPVLLRRLHRLLGDAYKKQDRFREAMEEYSWTPVPGV